jgi:peptidoglycan/LPS O-acetylase OafA/YrhL
MKIFGAIVLRYIRLTPSVAVVLLVYWKLLQYMLNGPFSVMLQKEFDRCNTSWWSTLTYTMNWLPEGQSMCMGWSWYLGLDMVFFIVCLLIMPIYHRRRWMGWSVLLVLGGVSLGITLMVAMQHPGMGIYVFDKHFAEYSKVMYYKTYSRIPAYLVGVAAAWLLEWLEQKGFTRETRPFTFRARLCASMIAFNAAVLGLINIFLHATDYGVNKDSWQAFPTLNAMYITFSRPVWAMSCAAITLLCYYGYLPLLDAFLSHQFWTPLARLSYGAYLCHPLVIAFAVGNATQFYTFGTMDLIYRFCGNSVLSFLGSLVLWALVERPCMTIFSPTKKRASDKSQRNVTPSAPHTQANGTSMPIVSAQSDPALGDKLDVKPGDNA